MSVLIGIPAAGASSRMGGIDKLTQEVGRGIPLLARTVKTAQDTGQPVIVVSNGDIQREKILTDASQNKLTIIPATDPTLGLSASIRDLANWAEVHSEITGLMIFLADMPDITAVDLNSMTAAFALDPETPLRATSADGEPGHPVIFPRRLFADLKQITGDTGAKSILVKHPANYVALPNIHATTDLDTPKDWEKWRKRVG